MQPLDDFDQRRDAGIGLRIDVDALLRRADQQFLEAGDPPAGVIAIACARELAAFCWEAATLD